MSALEFVNDPVVGSGEVVPYANRSDAGVAFGWQPGGDLAALVAFLGGDRYKILDGQLYEDEGGDSGVLIRQNTADAGVFVRWLTQPPSFIRADIVLQRGCVVRGEGVDGLGARVTELEAELEKVEALLDQANAEIEQLNHDLDAAAGAGKRPSKPAAATKKS